MFERKKTITVNGVSFNMILVEGDKFRIGIDEYEVDDFYMAEFPVSQKLFMKVMSSKGRTYTGSYDVNYGKLDYLDPIQIRHIGIVRNESPEELARRIEREIEEEKSWKKEKEEREQNNWEFNRSFPVNNVSWLEAVEFVKTLNELTGLNFGLPSFEQWYFAASGGLESKGYAFAGSDDANEVGHFNKLSTIVKSEGLFVMANKDKSNKDRKAATSIFKCAGHYRPNELGLFDMSGLVYEWLDKAGEVIGGSYYSNPDRVSKMQKYGYSQFNLADGSPETWYYSNFSSYSEKPMHLLGIRLTLERKPKEYEVPKEPSVVSEVTDIENEFIKRIIRIKDLGLLRSIIAEKFIKEPTSVCQSETWEYSNFMGNIYNVFVCPQNLPGFNGNCFSNYFSRRKFVNHCKEVFISLITSLCDSGYNLLIHDELGLNLTDSGLFSTLKVDIDSCKFKTKSERKWMPYLNGLTFITNNPDIFEFGENTYLIHDSKYIRLSENTILIEIIDTLQIKKSQEITSEWLYVVENKTRKNNRKDVLKICLNCFSMFESEPRECSVSASKEDRRSEDIIETINDHISGGFTRVNDKVFDRTSRVNKLFCSKNKGGLYKYKYPRSSGKYMIQDDKFFVLPQPVYEELRQSLKRKQ